MHRQRPTPQMTMYHYLVKMCRQSLKNIPPCTQVSYCAVGKPFVVVAAAAVVGVDIVAVAAVAAVQGKALD